MTMNKQQIVSAIQECMNFQAATNALVNPEWKTAGYAWKRAMWVEAAELTDLVGYKWWKDLNKAPDKKQILLEVVDIFHFLLSHTLVFRRYSATDLYHGYQWALKHSRVSEKEQQLQMIEEFVFNCLYDGEVVLHTSFFQMMNSLDIKIEDLLKYYIGKNALNKFRQDNGYKAGTYRKQWNLLGNQVEDNVVLEHIIENGAVFNFDSVYNQLTTMYNQ